MIIFVIMLTRQAGMDTAGISNQWPLAQAIAIAVFGGLTLILASVPLPIVAPPLEQDILPILGVALVDPNQYLIPFEISSVLLLAALIGSIYVSRRGQ